MRGQEHEVLPPAIHGRKRVRFGGKEGREEVASPSRTLCGHLSWKKPWLEECTRHVGCLVGKKPRYIFGMIECLGGLACGEPAKGVQSVVSVGPSHGLIGGGGR